MRATIGTYQTSNANMFFFFWSEVMFFWLSTSVLAYSNSHCWILIVWMLFLWSY
jgi:hypothetical protein